MEEVIVPLDFPDTSAKLKEISPTAKVPLLIWDDVTVWESLAITEWIADWAPVGAVWPEDAGKRAIARAVTSEMHAGFPALRKACPMDIRSRSETPDMTEALEADLSRALGLEVDIRNKAKGGELRIQYRDLEQLDEICRRLTRSA